MFGRFRIPVLKRSRTIACDERSSAKAAEDRAHCEERCSVLSTQIAEPYEDKIARM